MHAESPTRPLTRAQLGIWLGQRLDPSNPAYWTAEALELAGPLDRAAFVAALEGALAPLETLHACYEFVGDAPCAILAEPDAPASLAESDFSGAADPLAAALAWAQSQLVRPADLARGPLYRNLLARLGDSHFLWVFAAHHIALDGYAYGLVFDAVAAHYAARLGGTPTPPPGLAAVLAADRAYQTNGAASDRDWWRQRLADVPAPRPLAPARPLAHGVRRQRRHLDETTLEAIRTAARAAGTDWAAWLYALAAVWLARETGVRTQTLGLPAMLRLGTPALRVPCMAMNIAPLIVEIAPERSLAAHARAVAAELREIRPHLHYRYEDLRRDLAETDPGRRPFGTVVNLMPFSRPARFGPLLATAHPVSGGPVEDLALALAPDANGLRVDFDAHPDAYDDARLAGLADAWLATLSAALVRPDVPLTDVLDLDARRAVLHGEALAALAASVLHRLLEAAARRPWHPAVTQGDVALDYSKLLAEVRELAGRLHASGIGPGDWVGVLLPREPRTVVALLAVHWLGAAWVPLDPASPDARIAQVLADAHLASVLSVAKFAARLPGTAHVFLLDAPADDGPPLAEPLAPPPDSPAYVIYTSGSTGRPNGVRVGYAALAHFVAAAGRRYQIAEADRVLQFAPLHFDACIEEIFLALCHGATLVLRDDAMLESPRAFSLALSKARISVLDLPTAYWHELAWALGRGFAPPDSLRLVIIGGEAALAERVERWRRYAPASIWLENTYGPTEATVICATATLAGPGYLEYANEAIFHEGPLPGGPVPIGRPLPGVTLAVVDEVYRPLPQGEAGQLAVIGPTLALGYHDRAAVEAQRFVDLPALPGAPRAYLTGDRVVAGRDGQLVYLGRIDDEFKLSGHRIAPAEVETALLDCAGVREAAVIGVETADGLKHLVGFLVVETGVAPGDTAIRATLIERLPAPAVPTRLHRLAALPKNANNKIDRRSLRDFDLMREARPNEAAPAETGPNEAAVRAVWAEVLGAVPDASGDFFALGGKSLQAIQAANRLSERLGREVPVSLIFRYPDAAGLAAALDTEPARPMGVADPLAPLLTIQRGVEGAPALFCVHPAEGLAWAYFGLARHLPGVSIFGLQFPLLAGQPLADWDGLVADYLSRILTVQPRGPYRLLGWSSGGGIAHALACALEARGDAVELLAMMDSFPADIWVGKPEPTRRDALLNLLDVIGASEFAPDGRERDAVELEALLAAPESALAGHDHATLADACLASMAIYRQARHPIFHGPTLFFRAAIRAPDLPDWTVWAPYLAGPVTRVDIASDHRRMSLPEPLAAVGARLCANLMLVATFSHAIP